MVNTPMSLSALLTPQGGILVAKGYELSDLIGVPESNIRFALWNGTSWIELPYWINQETVLQTGRFEANGTSVKGVVSETYDRISKNDVISVKVPAEISIEANDGNWWSEALHLGLKSRFSLQVSARGGYGNFVYVYYQTNGRSLAPVYPSTQYSNSVLANGTQTALMSSSSPTSAILEVVSVSKPQTAVLYAVTTDPQVYGLDEVMLQKFQNTGWSQQPTDNFWLPDQGQAVTGVILRIEGQSVGDKYPGGGWIGRYLQVYVNNQKIWSDNSWNGKIVSGSFSFSPDITSRVGWWNEAAPIFNTASVYLTTFVGYWVIRAWIYVVYNANSHFITTYSQYSNWYKFQNTGWSIINFKAQLPESIANQANGAVITIHSKPYGDDYSRYLELYIDGQKIFRTTIGAENWKTWDITSYVLGKSGVTVGIVITTYVGYWLMDGSIAITSRPLVAPDSSTAWRHPTNSWNHFVAQRAGNIFDDGYAQNKWCGLFSFDSVLKEGLAVTPVTTGVAASVPDVDGARDGWYPYWVFNIEMHIKARYTSTPGVYLPADIFLNPNVYAGTSSGEWSQTGSDLLAILAAGLSITPETTPLACVAGVASVIVKHIQTSGIYFQKETNELHLNWWSDDNNSFKDQSILAQYEINWPTTGDYTVEVQTLIKIYVHTVIGQWAGTALFTSMFNYHHG